MSRADDHTYEPLPASDRQRPGRPTSCRICGLTKGHHLETCRHEPGQPECDTCGFQAEERSDR